jgi:hypothetical protein
MLLSFVNVILIYKTITTLVCKSDSDGKLIINEDIKFYSDHDIKYCIDLLIKDNKKNKEKKFIHHIYKWNENFKFSSRIINSHVVAIIALYYFFIDFVYYGVLMIDSLIGTTTDALSNIYLREGFFRCQNQVVKF